MTLKQNESLEADRRNILVSIHPYIKIYQAALIEHVFNVSNLTGGIFLDHSRLDEISIEIKA
jgi:hypothetical protein